MPFRFNPCQPCCTPLCSGTVALTYRDTGNWWSKTSGTSINFGFFTPPRPTLYAPDGSVVETVAYGGATTNFHTLAGVTGVYTVCASGTGCYQTEYGCTSVLVTGCAPFSASIFMDFNCNIQPPSAPQTCFTCSDFSHFLSGVTLTLTDGNGSYTSVESFGAHTWCTTATRDGFGGCCSATGLTSVTFPIKYQLVCGGFGLNLRCRYPVCQSGGVVGPMYGFASATQNNSCADIDDWTDGCAVSGICQFGFSTTAKNLITAPDSPYDCCGIQGFGQHNCVGAPSFIDGDTINPFSCGQITPIVNLSFTLADPLGLGNTNVTITL